MKNIWKVYLTDLRRITTNVVALSIVMGLCIIPSLYAWFNIMSNWDPYGESATSLMKVAVFSEDEGISMNGIQLTIGDMVVESLENNKTIDWIFPDTNDEAMELIKSGDCYAGIVIPASFTQDMLSILNGKIVNPNIIYYENSKKNAIATKITGKVKTTVQNEINTKIISTLTEVVADAGDYISGNNLDGADLVTGLQSKLQEISGNLDNFIYMMNTFSLLTESASGAIDTTQLLLPGIEDMAGSGSDTLDSLSDSIDIGDSVLNTASSLMVTSLNTIYNALDDLKKSTDSIDSGDHITSYVKGYGSLDILQENTFGTLENILEKDSAEFRAAKKDFENLKTSIEKLADDSQISQEDMDKLKAEIKSNIEKCQAQLNTVKELITGDLSSELDDTISNIKASLKNAKAILSGVSGDFKSLNKSLDDYQSVLDEGTGNVKATISYLKNLRADINQLNNDIAAITSNGTYQNAISAIRNNPQLIVDFISSPVQLNTVEIYAISNYGSAMAPFYTVLALWVGALILVALIHVKVKDSDELNGVKSYQKFFGRYLNFFVIGQIQTIITVMGDLFYVEIQCKHPIAFALAAMMTSFVFTFLIYSLTVAFGNIGEAIAVVIMVIQVAGAGGTFPVEVLPSVYQYLYKFMPFSYCMNALRECVAGMYQHTYGKCLATLLIYVGISVIIGLLLAKPCAKLLDKLEHSKEKSGLFI